MAEKIPVRFVKYFDPDCHIEIRSFDVANPEQARITSAIDEHLRRERRAEEFRAHLYRSA